jgi:V/A-type H+-transporting ATPase subunit E
MEVIMTVEEKLEHFYVSVIDSATAQGLQIVTDYEGTLKNLYEERKQAALKKADQTYRIEAESIHREKNRMLSNETIEIKRKLLEKTAEVTDRVFTDVVNKLTEFMNTPAYAEWLCGKINAANALAPDTLIIIYINPTDQKLKSSLEDKTGIKLTVSDRDFIGGIRAVIPSRSILIDYSFLTKLTEERNAFKL